MRQTLPLQLAHDIAIKSKHGTQSEPPWAGDVGGDVVSQSVSVFVGTGQSAHYWRITYTPAGAGQLGEVSIDALVLSQEVVAALAVATRRRWATRLRSDSCFTDLPLPQHQLNGCGVPDQYLLWDAF